jgi:tRNA nucleotidyltransferase (CCA-adding enzyme)
VCKRLKVPSECRDLAVMTAREHGNVGRALQLRPNTIVTLLERCDAFRKPARFTQMLLATECDSCGREGNGVSFRDKPFPQLAHLEKALAAARGVNAGEIAQRSAEQPQRIPEMIHRARVSAVRAALGAGEDDERDGKQDDKQDGSATLAVL